MIEEVRDQHKKPEYSGPGLYRMDTSEDQDLAHARPETSIDGQKANYDPMAAWYANAVKTKEEPKTTTPLPPPGLT
eukprot:4018559-Lingulodinium_polyedra.AAC.1